MIIKILSYFRKDTSTLLAFSAGIALLLLLSSSPLVLFNLQAVQASSYPISYRTTEPAEGSTSCTSGEVWLTFDAQGYYNSGDGNVNSGKFQVTNSSGEILISGDMKGGDYNNSTGSGGRLTIVQLTFDHAPNRCSSNPNLVILTSCSSSDGNLIRFSSQGSEDFSAQFSGPVKCSLVGNTNTNTTQQQQPSPMTGTTTQDGGGSSSDGDSNNGDGDSDSDGIPDSSDNCPNHSHHRCFKEGEASTTTATTTNTNTTQQQSSSSMSGNQTKDR